MAYETCGIPQIFIRIRHWLSCRTMGGVTMCIREASYRCHLCMSVKSCGTHLDAILLIFSKSFRMWRAVECASPVSCSNWRIVTFRSTSTNADISCTVSSLTGGWPDRGMCSKRSRQSRKATTHLATVLYGNAAASHASCNTRWHSLAVQPLAHWIFIHVLCSCLENIVTVFRERWLPTTHLTGATAHERWRVRARSCALREGMRVSNLREKWQRPTLLQLSTEALVPNLKNQPMYFLSSVHLFIVAKNKSVQYCDRW